MMHIVEFRQSFLLFMVNLLVLLALFLMSMYHQYSTVCGIISLLPMFNNIQVETAQPLSKLCLEFPDLYIGKSLFS